MQYQMLFVHLFQNIANYFMFGFDFSSSWQEYDYQRLHFTLAMFDKCSGCDKTDMEVESGLIGIAKQL